MFREIIWKYVVLFLWPEAEQSIYGKKPGVSMPTSVCTTKIPFPSAADMKARRKGVHMSSRRTQIEIEKHWGFLLETSSVKKTAAKKKKTAPKKKTTSKKKAVAKKKKTTKKK